MTLAYTIPGAEPFYVQGGKTGCLLIHGFTGTPKEMRMLAESLAMENYTILAPRLFAHASDPEHMNRAKWEDWVLTVEDGLNLLRGCTDQQVIMGLSMGGVLALLTAAKFAVAGVVTFSAPGRMPFPERTRWLPIAQHFVRRIPKGTPDWHNVEAQKDHIDYPFYPTRSIIQLKKLIAEMQKELPGVTSPALLVQSRLDRGIPSDSLDQIFSKISSPDKTAFYVENSGHVVIREPDRELIFLEVKKFLRRVA